MGTKHNRIVCYATHYAALRRPCYDATHRIAPAIPIIGSEMGSTTSDRGVYAGSNNVSVRRGDGGSVPEVQASMQVR